MILREDTVSLQPGAASGLIARIEPEGGVSNRIEGSSEAVLVNVYTGEC